MTFDFSAVSHTHGVPDLRTTLPQFLKAHGLKLNTDLGQHFLIDQSVLDAITEAAKIEPTDHVVEIGPGVGVLTKELLQRAAHITSIELDSRMIPLIEEYLKLTPIEDPVQTPYHGVSAPGQLTLIEGNALQEPMPTEPYKLVANIPYHITSPLFRHVFLQSPMLPTSVTFLMQREVAERIADTEDAGILTIIVGLFGKARLVRHVAPECFTPPPKVDSSVLHVDCYAEPLADSETLEEVFRLTKIAFSQKRKMLRNTLGAFQDVTERLKALGIEETRRPQTLSVQEWIALAQRG